MPAAAAHRPAAWPRLLLLAAAVLLLHGGLASHWQRPAQPVAGPAGSRRVAVTLLRSPQPQPQATALAPLPAALAPDTVPAVEPAPPPRAARPDAPPTGAVAALAPAQQSAAAPAIDDPLDRQNAQNPQHPHNPPDRPVTINAPSLADPSDAPASPETGAAEPPLVYPTLPPTPALLRYHLRHNRQAGEAVLAWRHDGQRYALSFEARLDGPGPLPGKRPPLLIEQASLGGFDAAGLAPERFTDRRHGRGWRAANFRRDVGRISFSGPSVEYPAWPGVQDRLSWLVQLVAIQAAAATPPSQLSLFVVDARGGGERWHFEALEDEPVETASGRWPARHWRRQPERPERPDSQRVEVWLAPGLGHWPLQLRVTTLRTGDETLWRLAADPAPP